MARVQQGNWVVKDAQGRYQKIPVYYYWDDNGNLLGYRDAYGNVYSFETQYSVGPHGHYYSANACDYFIGTVPKERWVMVDPLRAGIIDDTGRVWPLNHSLADIAAKRADVADWLCTQYHVCLGPGVNSSATTLPSPTRPKYVGCCRLPMQNANATSAATRSSSDLDTQALGVGLMDLVNQFAMAMLAAAPPGFQQLYQIMRNEGFRQELLLRQKLPPERYEYYNKLRQKANMLANQGVITDDQWRSILRLIYKRMVEEAGLNEEELLRSSPYMKAIPEALRQIPGASNVAGLVEARITGQISPLKSRILAIWNRLSPTERRQVIETISKLPATQKERIRAILT